MRSLIALAFLVPLAASAQSVFYHPVDIDIESVRVATDRTARDSTVKVRIPLGITNCNPLVLHFDRNQEGLPGILVQATADNLGVRTTIEDPLPEFDTFCKIVEASITAPIQ